MKNLILSVLFSGFWSANLFAAERAILTCEGVFEESTTSKVEVFSNDQSIVMLRESFQDGSSTSREVSADEIQARSFRISDIYEITRTIKPSEIGWVVEFGCGETREITCNEFK